MNNELWSESEQLFLATQQGFITALQHIDPQLQIITDRFEREVTGSPVELYPPGYGITKALRGTGLVEKGGVNFSSVGGVLPSGMTERLVGKACETPFRATGVSVVIHPHSPQVPTVHFNCRYLEMPGHSWFGGGGDLTPYVLVEDDARYFHQQLKLVCDRHNAGFYADFKQQCDKYFYLPHRKETRGVGGLFFDYLGRDAGGLQVGAYQAFIADLCQQFPLVYQKIASDAIHRPCTEQQKKFQLLRRGRYVEFNLMYDRGTEFGLRSNGRVESILMSLPAHVSWEYNWQPQPDSEEEKLLRVLANPREWI